MYIKMTGNTYHQPKHWWLKSISFYLLDSGIAVLRIAAAFKFAFDAMASPFEITLEDLTPKRKALKITAYTTLYTKFHLPSKKIFDAYEAFHIAVK